MKNREEIPSILSLAMSRTRTSVEDQLAASDDLIIRAWSAAKLAENQQGMSYVALKNSLQAAKQSPYLRTILGPYLLSIGMYDQYRALHKLGLSEQERKSALHSALLKASFEVDYETTLAIYEQLFLVTGNEFYVRAASDLSIRYTQAEQAEIWFLRSVAARVRPLQEAAFVWLIALARQGEKEKFVEYSEHLENLDVQETLLAYASAQRDVWEGDINKALDVIEHARLSEALAKSHAPSGLHFIAETYHKAKRFNDSAAVYGRMNGCLREENVHGPTDFVDNIAKYEAWALPSSCPPPVLDKNYCMLLSFPRSGTTLLDNVLSSHPDITVCEETNSFARALTAAFKLGEPNYDDEHEMAERIKTHRRLYHIGLERFFSQDSSTVIDKTPIHTAYARLLSLICPEWKFIFAIRHPYDVILSNWRQAFNQNKPMAAFNDMRDASYAYDAVMKHWFAYFPIDDPRVHYVHYSDVVQDFEGTVGRILKFLGEAWDDTVLDFATTAEKRAVRTPSYANVRKGLSLGVQSSYQNYLFLFDDYCRSKLDPWVEFFGYTVEEPKK